MGNPENPAFNLKRQEFEATPVYRDIDRAPKTVVTQTDQVIALSSAGILRPDTTYNYLSTYTLPFLKSAQSGVGKVYDREIAIIALQSPEVNEAADFTNIVFSWMHYFAKSQFLPNGFARGGVLKAPETSREFIERIQELKLSLSLVASGDKITKVSFMANPRAFRTYSFFKVGSTMPLRFIESDKQRKEHEDEILAKLLEGIDTNFLT